MKKSHAANPLNPHLSRHIVRKAQVQAQVEPEELPHRPVGDLMLIRSDALRVLNWLGEQPLRTITSEGMRQWVDAQRPRWTRGYWKTVRTMVSDQLADRVADAGKDIRARMLATTERLFEDCREVVVHAGDLVHDKRSTEYRRWIELKSADDAWAQYDRRREDYVKALERQAGGGPHPGPPPTEPRSPRLTEREAAQMTELAKCLPFLTKLDHGAALGYLKFQATLHGLDTPQVQHLHLHQAIQTGADLSDVPESELIAAMNVKVRDA